MALPKLAGIYAIRHMATGRVYVGSSLNIQQRVTKHRCLLRVKNHPSPSLQAAWIKYGEEAFVFEVMEIVDNPSDLLAREQYWMDQFMAYEKGHGFNILKEAGTRRHHVNSLEARQKQRLSMLARWKSEPWRREEARAKFLGRKMTPEAIEKSASSRRGKKASAEHRANLSKAHKGIKLSAAHAAAIGAGAPKKRSAAFRAAVSAGIKQHWKTRRRKNHTSSYQLRLL